MNAKRSAFHNAYFNFIHLLQGTLKAEGKGQLALGLVSKIAFGVYHVLHRNWDKFGKMFSSLRSYQKGRPSLP